MQALINDLIYEVQGEKAFAFLHGQLSNHIKGMQNAESIFNFLLNNKGKIQAALFVYRDSQRCLIAVPEVCAPVLIEHLQKLAGLSGVQIIAQPDWQIVHVISDTSLASAATNAKPHSPNADDSALASSSLFAITANRFQVMGVDHFVEKNFLPLAGPFLTPEELEDLRIRQGMPRFGVDYLSQHLPQETGLFAGLHFDKGCYLGQEIVARLQYRGQVKKQLVCWQVSGVNIQGEQVLRNVAQEEIGKTTSLVFDSTKNATVGLAWLQTTAVENPLGVTLGGHAVKIFPLALQSAKEPIRN